MIPPGEPGDASGFVNLDYPGSTAGGYRIRRGMMSFETYQDPETGDWYCTDARRCDAIARVPSPTPIQDDQGLPFRAPVALDGVLYVGGQLAVQGESGFFGSVVARRGVSAGPGRPRFFFDDALARGRWPRAGMIVPRVVVTAWQTDR